MARYRRGTVTIECSEIIDQIEDEDLLDEVRRRDLDLKIIDDRDDIERAYEALYANRVADALSILDRIVRPKWKSEEQCRKRYNEARTQ